MLDDEEIKEELVDALEKLLFEVTKMEEAVAEASQTEVEPGDRVLITREIDALWDQGDSLMSWLVERPSREDN
jgi:regulator of RNase E activity RraB